MRAILSLLLLAAFSAPSFGVASASYDITKVTAAPQAPLTLTTTETTVTLTNNGQQDRLVEIVVDQDWGWSDATGAFSAKYPLSAKQAHRYRISTGVTILYVQTATTSGTLHAEVLERIDP